MSFEKYLQVDAELWKLSREISRLLTYLEPLNREEQRKKFLKGKISEPKFEYRDLGYDAEDWRRRVESVKVSNDDVKLKDLFERLKLEFLYKNEVIVGRGNKERIMKASKNLYGDLDEEALKLARDWLKHKGGEEVGEELMDASLVVDELRKGLRGYGLRGWRVKLVNKQLVTVNRTRKTITIGKLAKFSAKMIAKTIIHEVGVHALRAENGYRQPLKIFVSGFPGYYCTEEGLAVYVEEVTGNSSVETMRNYAGRVVAVKSLIEGAVFLETFRMLRKYGFGDDEAWDLGVRVYRGGGFIKDHVYLQGYLDIKKFVAGGGDWRELFVGKVGLGDMVLIKKWLEKGIIKKAKNLPVIKIG